MTTFTNHLFSVIPAGAGITFCAFVYLLYLNRKIIIQFLSTINRASYGWLAALFFIALLIRLFIPPVQHIMYVDEAWYMEAAKNLLVNGHQGDYPKSIGWPFFLSFFFLLFGVNNWVALYTMIVIGAMTTVVLFLLAFILTRDRAVSLWAALLISIHPVHVRWSASAETNVVSSFMVCLSLFFCFLYYRHKNRSLLWLSLSAVSFAAQFRPENYVLFILFFVGDVMFNGKNIRQNIGSYILPWVIFITLSLPNLVQVLYFTSSMNHIESGSNGLLHGSNWGFGNLIYNTRHYGIHIFNGTFQPALIFVLALIGTVVLAIRQRKELLFLSAWIGFFWLIYFSSWLQTSGDTDAVVAKGRLFISFYPAMIILASSGIVSVLRFIIGKTTRPALGKYVYAAGIILIVALFVPYEGFVSNMFSDEKHLLETKIPELAERDIPSSCVIIANWPTILKSTTELSVVDITVFLESQEYQKKLLETSDCVLFFQDLTCEIFKSEKERCFIIKQEYAMKEYLSYTEGSQTYIFYQLSDRKDSPGTKW